MSRRTGGYAAAGFVLGVIAGALFWSNQIRRARHGLFSSNPVRRLAALGYLKGNAAAVSPSVLRDYVRWERRPSLRRRGERLLRRLQRHAG